MLIRYANIFLRRQINFLSMSSTRTFLTAEFPELKSFPKEINNYESLHRFSLEQSDLFWSTLAKSRLDWIKPFTKVREGDFDKNSVDSFDLKWFVNGKLNVSGNKQKTSIIIQVSWLCVCC